MADGTTTAARPSRPSTLRGSGFGRLWLSTGSANLGDGVLFAGLPVLATTVTDAPAAVAAVTVALMLPMVIAALPAGALADRLDRRCILILGNAGRAAAMLALLMIAVLVDVRLALVYAIAVAAASSEVLVDTTAQTAVPGLVPEDRLDGANARLMVTQVVNNDAIGAPIGAALATLGVGALLGPSAVLYAVAAVAAARLRTPVASRRTDGDGRPSPPAASSASSPTPAPRSGALRQVRHEVAQGLAHLAQDVTLRRLAVANALSNLGNTAFGAVLVLFVIGPLGLPAAAYGGLLSALAVGAVLGGLVAERLLRQTGSMIGIRAGFAVAVGSYLVLAVATEVRVVAVTAAVLGAASMLINVAARTLRQRLVPDALLGRVTASMAAVALVATPLGAALGGIVAQWIGLRAIPWVAVLTNVIALLLLWPPRTRPVRGAPYGRARCGTSTGTTPLPPSGTSARRPPWT